VGSRDGYLAGNGIYVLIAADNEQAVVSAANAARAVGSLG
jgi:hypothetical protein